MKLFNELTKIKKEEKSMKIKKKKGFTLIELIAVIAILAILGAIIIPNVIGYTTKANTAKVKADANILMNGINSYNAENNNVITNVNMAVTTGAVANTTYDISTLIPKIPDEFAGQSITTAKLQGIADGTGTYTVDATTKKVTAN